MPKHWTQEALRNAGFVYGRNLFGNLKRALKWVDPDKIGRFDNWDIDEGVFHIDKGDYIEGCVCGHAIKYEYRIIHKHTRDTMEIGCICIDKFSETMRLKRLLLLNKKLNPKSIFCSRCKKKISKCVVDQFPDEEFIFHKTCFKKNKKDIYDNEEVLCSYNIQLNCVEKMRRIDLNEHLENHKDEIQLHDALNTKMVWGKYKHFLMKNILNHDKGYIIWLSKKSFSDDIKEICMLILK
jgi:uncharacterized protein (DUF3820 family)